MSFYIFLLSFYYSCNSSGTPTSNLHIASGADSSSIESALGENIFATDTILNKNIAVNKSGDIKSGRDPVNRDVSGPLESVDNKANSTIQVTKETNKRSDSLSGQDQILVQEDDSSDTRTDLFNVHGYGNLHDSWDILLKQHVNAKGEVNYKEFINSSEELEGYLLTLSETRIQELDIKELFAFWINAYNAFTIKLILDHYPVQSIMDIGDGKVWDRKWIMVNGQSYSLNDIEKNELIKKYQDPRVHFAVNCAAASCPPLANRAWTTNNLNSMLEKRTEQFINNPRYNNVGSDSAELSMIFNWYAKDFQDLIGFINTYSEIELKHNAPIKYIDYSWDLNKQ